MDKDGTPVLTKAEVEKIIKTVSVSKRYAKHPELFNTSSEIRKRAAPKFKILRGSDGCYLSQTSEERVITEVSRRVFVVTNSR